MQTRLTRNSSERMMAGVCAGLAEYFVVDPVLVRLIFVLVFFTSGLSLPIYLVLWLIMPARPGEAVSTAARSQAPPMAAYRYDPQTGQALRVEPPATGATVQLRAQQAGGTVGNEAPAGRAVTQQPNWQWLGLVLIGAGVVMLMRLVGVSPTYLIAGLLIGFGALLLLRRR